MRRLLAFVVLGLSLPVSLEAHPGHGGNGGYVPANQNPPGQNEVSIQEEGGYRVITANGIPEGKVGAFPNQENPNSIRPQRYRFRVPLQPKKTGTLTPLPLQNFGIGVNGVPFDPAAAEWWNNDRNSGWQKEAISAKHVILGIDTNHAHVQPTGAYHYHGVPTDLMPQGTPSEMVLVGYAADGFPIYGVYGYTEANDAKSKVKELKPSYRLKRGKRPSGSQGPGGRYDGTYTQDYEYVEGLGDLDEANGRSGVTPEYPQGTYYYVVTNQFPYIPRYWVGTPDSSFQRQGPGGRRGPGGGQGGQGGSHGGHGGHHPPPHHQGGGGHHPPPHHQGGHPPPRH